MLTDSFESDLRVWIQVTKNSLNSGNRVGSARLHAIQMMINTRLEWLEHGHWQSDPELKHKP